MLDPRLAERLLSLATTPDRASAIVGDLMEDPESARPWRFWPLILRTTLSLTRRQIAEKPFAAARALAIALCADTSYVLLWTFVATLLIFGPLEGLSRTFFHAELPDRTGKWLIFWLSNIGAAWAMGGWIYRVVPSRRAAMILSLAILHAAINLVFGTACWLISFTGAEAHFDITVAVPLIGWNPDLVHTLRIAALYLTLYPLALLCGALAADTKSTKYLA